MMLMFWNELLMDDISLNPWWMMKQKWNVWLNSWWMLTQLWNVDRVLDECWNDDENVNGIQDRWPSCDWWLASANDMHDGWLSCDC